MGQETWNGPRAAMLERRFATSGDSAHEEETPRCASPIEESAPLEK